MSFSTLRSLGAAAAICTLALTGCGGGGGTGGAALPVANPTPASPKSTPSPQSLQQQAAVLSAAQQARTQKWLAQYIGTSTSPARFRRSARSLALRAFDSVSPSPSASPSTGPSASPAPACSGNQNQSAKQNPDGSITINETGYYDDACTTLEYTSVETISVPDSSGKMTSTGTQTQYNPDGVTVAEYDISNGVIYNANYGSGNIVMSIARYANQSASKGTPLDTDYFAEVDKSGSSMSIGAASISQDPAFPGGVLASNATYQTTITGGLYGTNETDNETGSTTNLQDQAGHISVGSFPLAAGNYQWTLSGGHVLNTTTETETSTSDTTGYLLSYSDTIVDAADDITTTITGNAGGTQYKGTLKQTSTGAVLATFVVDGDGNGTITFSNGTTQPVENWCWA